MRLGVANNMHPLSWGGGGHKRKRSKFYFHKALKNVSTKSYCFPPIIINKNSDFLRRYKESHLQTCIYSTSRMQKTKIQKTCNKTSILLEGSFPFVPPPPSTLCSITIMPLNTRHYIVNHYVKICHVSLGMQIICTH